MTKGMTSSVGRGMSAFVGTLLVIACLPSSADGQSSSGPVKDLSIEELARLEVTSVSRRQESIADAQASIFVITAEDIRRAGVTTLAEALRLAPNLLVAQVDAGQYAISARGFNGVIANKLLVLIDNRTVYTPLFSGVFWDQQDVLLEDVERIEIISGPGATLWGANAVNGVINVTTRSARDTHGLLASVAAGNRQQTAAIRYGGEIGSVGHYRAYVKATSLEASQRADGSPVFDRRAWLQAGFRTDWGDSRRGATLQGDVYGVRSQDRGAVGPFVFGRVELSGLNVLANWVHTLNGGSNLRLQAYFDHARRDERILFQPVADLWDVELQHGFSRGLQHVVWGAGYRHGRDNVRDGLLVGFRPTQRPQDWLNAYVQDDVRLGETINLRGGIRFDRNDYTGWEYQGNARLSWKPSSDRLVWGGFSRAVRAPSRIDRDVIRPLGGGIFGGPNFVSEVANVIQAGYRERTAGVLTWSVTTFLHRWDDLRSGTGLPVFIENKIEGPAYGVEGWATWQLSSAWRVHSGFTVLRKDLRLEPDSGDPIGVDNPNLSNDPGGQWMLRSSLTPWSNHEVDGTIRRVGKLPHPVVPAYTAVDMRYAWRARPSLELSVLGQNLFDPSHPEFNAAPARAEFARGVLVRATWRR
jgi:iron complex outermembrane recepter protein